MHAQGHAAEELDGPLPPAVAICDPPRWATSSSAHGHGLAAPPSGAVSVGLASNNPGFSPPIVALVGEQRKMAGSVRYNNYTKR